MAKLHKIELTKDQSMIPAIHEYLADKEWKSAVILCGVGSLYDVTLTNPRSRTPGQPLAELKLDGPCELTSFTGEIIRREEVPTGLERYLKEGEPSRYLVHIHGSVSHGRCVSNGGAIRGGTVSRAVNIYVLEDD